MDASFNSFNDPAIFCWCGVQLLKDVATMRLDRCDSCSLGIKPSSEALRMATFSIPADHFPAACQATTMIRIYDTPRGVIGALPGGAAEYHLVEAEAIYGLFDHGIP